MHAGAGKEWAMLPEMRSTQVLTSSLPTLLPPSVLARNGWKQRMSDSSEPKAPLRALNSLMLAGYAPHRHIVALTRLASPPPCPPCVPSDLAARSAGADPRADPPP